jgi:hypothetical protein
MEKSNAIELINNKTKLGLIYGNTRFANVGKHKDSWWLEPTEESLKSGFFMVLNDEIRDRLLLFKVPPNTLKSTDFRYREDIEAAQIIIPISQSKYVDRKGFDFTKYLIKVIEY